MGYEVAKYDLRNEDDVLQLGKEIGIEGAQELRPLTDEMSLEIRCVFYAALLAAYYGNMSAAIGPEAAGAVMDTLKTLAINPAKVGH